MSFKTLFNSQLNTSTYSSLYAIRDNQSLIKRLSLNSKLEVHRGCVNSICWSDYDPSILLSGSDDQNLSITNVFSGLKKAQIHTGHKTNIFSAKFLPNSSDEKIISSSSGGDIYLTDTNKSTSLNNQNHYCCHGDKTCYEIRTCYDSFNFTSCGQDGTVKWFDIRQSSKCDKKFCLEHTLIKISNGISTIAINPTVPYHLVCGGMDGILRMYDRRMLSVGSYDTENQSLLANASQSAKGLFACFNPFSLSNDSRQSILNNNQANSKRITSVQYDCLGNQLLVSYQSDLLYLLDWRDLTDEKEKSNEQESNLQQEQSPNSSERKFRIQSDWSDTGPNSVPYNEMETSDPRAFLARRLGEWFSNITNNRANTRSIINRTNETLNRSTLSATTNEQSTVQEVPDSRKIGHEANNEASEDDPNFSEDENAEPDAGDNRSQNQPDTRENLLSITTSFIGSRLRTKQANRLENNAIKNKPSPKVKMVFTGHRNARTIIKECNFWGNDFIMSGSDCGHVYFWNKHTGKIINILEADKHVVNCVQENPVYPVLASSGIDYNIKVWEPTLDYPVNVESKIDLIIKRNKMMLEESKNTIFIPVQFMLPALRLFGTNTGRNSRNTQSMNTTNNDLTNSTSESNQNHQNNN